ncbi:MAG TPA: SGNH/GDSL hydrolase family protein [Spirillospora sp.]|nr:SGNH/GDSL hydrolase family protein [Spirillospora sp.]
MRVVWRMALSTLMVLLLAEVLARVVLWRSPNLNQPREPEFGYSVTGYGDLVPNLNRVERLYNIRPYFLQTNSAGLRNTDEIRDGVVRILAIGDSFTYGMYVHNQETFPARLEEVLNQRLENRVQVLNAGVPGYTIADELSYLLDKGLALEPDVVVLGVYTNDIFDFYPPVREVLARPVLLASASGLEIPEEQDSFLRENLALYNALLQLRGQYGQARIEQQINRVTPTIEGLHRVYQDLTFLRPQDFPDEWAAYERNLREMIALLQERQIPLVIVAFPDVAQLPVEGGLPDVPQQMLARIADETGTPFVDLLPVFRELGDIQTLYLLYYNRDAQIDPNAPDAAVLAYSGDGHPTPYAYLETGRLVANLLLEYALLPDM